MSTSIYVQVGGAMAGMEIEKLWPPSTKGLKNQRYEMDKYRYS
jgi:hypothetical protein